MKIKYSNLLVGLLLPLTVINAESALTPPDAKPGECYARVMTPAQFETIQEKVMVKEATEEISIVPAQYETIEQNVEVTPESKKLVPVPAKYKNIVETIEVKPASSVWKTSLGKKALPVSQLLLGAVKAQGLDVENATSGTCYKEYYQPATYKIVEEDVIVQNERNETKVIPAKYEDKEQEIEVIPPSKKVVEIPAEHEYVEEKVLIEEAKTVWKKGKNPAQKLTGATGEIMCLVKIPAKYKTIKKKIVRTPATTRIVEIPAEAKTIKIKRLLTPAQTRVVEIPAVKKTIKKKVLDSKPEFAWIRRGNSVHRGLHFTGHQICLLETPAEAIKITQTVLETPASTREIPFSATHKTVKVKKLIEEAQEIKSPIPAVYKMLSKKEKISEAHQSWERILCQTNMNKHVILQIQRALQSKSYSPGKIDGVLGRGTRVALDKYQRDNSLATGGITYETLNALGIDL